MFKFPMTDRQFHDLLRSENCEELFDEYPFYPLTSPGMPFPGVDFIEEAKRLGDEDLQVEGAGKNAQLVSTGKYLNYLYMRALYDSTFTMTVEVKGVPKTAEFVTGHKLGGPAEGPVRADVMVVGKMPGREELGWAAGRRNFVGPSAKLLEDRLEALGVPEDMFLEWYVTNLVRHQHLTTNSNALPRAWVKNCAPLLEQELRLVRPKFILCLGTEASKHLLGPSGGVEGMRGRVAEFRYRVDDATDLEPEFCVAHVVTVVHPAAVLRSPDRQDELDLGIKRFVRIVDGGSPLDVESDIDHRVVYKQRELRKIVDAIIEEPGDELILAVDAEWHGENPWEPGSYLRAIQFSHRSKFAVCVVLNGEGGVPEFVPSIEAAADELKRLFDCPGKRVRVGGHFFRSDIPWILDKLGIDLRRHYAPPMDGGSDSWKDTKTVGGFDTALMCHAIFETSRFKLEDVAVRHTTCPRWDVDLQSWKKSYCSSNGLKDKDLEGYGACPSEILHPYACYDADATRRLYDVFDELLDCDVQGNNCRKAYWTSHIASLAVLEMERTGLGVDLARAEDLIRTFSEARASLLQVLRQDINWPDFNPASAPHCRALLFGDEYAKKVDKDSTGLINVRPEDATTLGLTPITTTGQRPKAWEYVATRGQSNEYVPSTNGETLGILGQQNPIAARVRDIRFLEQVLKTTLRHPDQAADGTPVADPETGRSVYSSGLLSHIGSDEKIHTHLLQTMETGRFSSSRPNLQNISKRREDDYRRILGDHYKYPIRTIFTARPGHVFVEADYTGAELAGIMWMSQDANGIDHVRRNMLPEDHPDYYDIHSRAAVSAFNLDCAPTKRGLYDAGCPGMRVAAKNVNFGIPYGRGSAALARQCREEGVELTEFEAQKLIDNYFETYPSTKFFLSDCRARVVDPGWICNAFGRYRRFPATNERSVLGELERQAQNFPIQSLVADAMSCAIYQLYKHRESCDVDYKIVLQIHDAVLLEVPIEHLDYVCNVSLPYCMTEMVPIVPTDLDGTPLVVDEPYYLACDRDISVHWGANLTAEQAQELGVPAHLV